MPVLKEVFANKKKHGPPVVAATVQTTQRNRRAFHQKMLITSTGIRYNGNTT